MLRTRISGVAHSHEGNPPNSHSAQLYGPGRTITHNPSSCAVRMKAAMSRLSSKWNSPGRGSCAFQNEYMHSVLSPMARIFFMRSRQYGRGMRA